MSEPERLLLLTYDYVEDMAERRTPHRPAHLEHLARGKADGRIVIAGAVGDPPRRGLIAFRTGDPESVERFAREDPYVTAGLVTDWRVEPWTVV